MELKPSYQPANVNGYILAGGKSTRMGSDKGLMLFNGKPLVTHIINQLQPAVGQVIIVTNNPDYQQFGLECIPDNIAEVGPAGGIESALTHSRVAHNFIIGCDMPFVSTAAIQWLLEQAGSASIIIPEHDGKIEPLFGIYDSNCLPQWHALIQQGLRKLQSMIACFSLLQPDVTGNMLFHDTLFMNINTYEELKKALNNNNL